MRNPRERGGVYSTMWTAFLAGLAFLVASGCAADDAPADPATAVPTVTASAPLPTRRDLAAGNAQADILDALKADLAARLATPVASIAVRSYCAVTWPDGSIGVAVPGNLYTQALVPGFLAELTAAGKIYRYHGTPTSFIAATFEPGVQIDTGVSCP